MVEPGFLGALPEVGMIAEDLMEVSPFGPTKIGLEELERPIRDSDPTPRASVYFDEC